MSLGPNILASLTEDEITVLGIMFNSANKTQNSLYSAKKRMPLLVTDPGKGELEKVLPEYRTIQQALLRTGLITMELSATTELNKLAEARNALNLSDGSGPDYEVETRPYYTFKVTPLMCELSEYIPDLIRLDP